MNEHCYNNAEKTIKKISKKMYLIDTKKKAMKLFPLFLLLLLYVNASAQKPPLDINSYTKWQEVINGKISNDGKFIYYQITNSPFNNSLTTVITTPNKEKEWNFTNLFNISFSGDSQFFIGKQNDSLLLINLKKNEVRYIPNVKSYTIIDPPSKNFLLYQTSENELIIESSEAKVLKKLDSVERYQLSPNNKSLFTLSQDKSSKLETITYINLQNYQAEQIYKASTPNNLLFDCQQNQVAFFSKNGTERTLWYYKIGTSKAIELASSHSPGIDSTYFIDEGSYWRFSPNGKYILFGQTEAKRERAKPSDIEVWNYKDLYLLSNFKSYINEYTPLFRPRSFLTRINIETKKITPLQINGEIIDPFSFMDKESNYFVFFDKIRRDPSAEDEKMFNYGVCNIETGEKKILEKNCVDQIQKFTFSPSHKYLIYYKNKTGQYYSYDLISLNESCLTCNIPAKFHNEFSKDFPRYTKIPSNIVGWLDDAPRVLISDTYDIWSIDLTNSKDAINLTHGLGRTSAIVFNPIEDKTNGYYGGNRKYGSKSNLVLKFFNLKTKERGFCQIPTTIGKQPTFLSTEKTATGGLNFLYDILTPSEFSKSKSATAYLLRKETFNDAPNYFYSKDLITFKRITNIQPQKEFNWLAAELHTYVDSSGTEYQGILYKPENFDSTKKYPVIFNYYEQSSNELNKFLSFDLGSGSINIPFMVSQGYLVYRPDIKTVPMKAGEGILKTINAALDHLKKYPFINLNKVAMTGWSFGGWETNYIITHLNRPIAAAITGAGACDLVTNGFTLTGVGTPKFGYIQDGPMKIGYTFEKNPQAYIDNSPLYFASAVQTPLLIIHNPKDYNVEQYQGISFFIQLRKLDKPCWLLSYKDEGHAISRTDFLIDVRMKILEYLDYYLKDKKEPNWMAQPITAED